MREVVFYGKSVPLDGTVGFTDMIHNWSVVQLKIPSSLPLMDCRPTLANSLDHQRIEIFMGVLELDQKVRNDFHLTVQFWQEPSILRSSIAIPKGKLVLVPVMALSAIRTSKSAVHFGAYEIEGKSYDFYGHGHPKWSEAMQNMAPEKAKELPNALFFYMNSTSVEAEANMVQDVVKHHGVQIPTFKNNVAIPANTRIAYYHKVEAQVKTPTLRISGAASSSSAAAKPEAKQKGKGKKRKSQGES